MFRIKGGKEGPLFYSRINSEKEKESGSKMRLWKGLPEFLTKRRPPFKNSVSAFLRNLYLQKNWTCNISSYFLSFSPGSLSLSFSCQLPDLIPSPRADRPNRGNGGGMQSRSDLIKDSPQIERNISKYYTFQLNVGFSVWCEFTRNIVGEFLPVSGPSHK